MTVLVQIRECFLNLLLRIRREICLCQRQEARPTGYYSISLLVHLFQRGLYFGLGLSGIAVRFWHRLVLLSGGRILIVVNPAAMKEERRIGRLELTSLLILSQRFVLVLVVIADHGQRAVKISKRYLRVELWIDDTRRFSSFEKANGAVGEIRRFGGMRINCWIGRKFVGAYL